MKIPRYWARAQGSASSPDGRRFFLDLWGWSHESVAEAKASAERRAADIAARVGQGGAITIYPYGERPLREERIRLIGDDINPGGPQAIVTRNRYGALVLNAARVPFIDVDVPEEPASKKLFSFFGGKTASANAPLDRVREACRRHALQSFRIYRTKAGYRILATDMTLEPKSEVARSLLEGFGADPHFVLLCRQQESFRARLTPKPWRCDCPLPPGQFPRDDVHQQDFEAWLQDYERRAAGYATCQFVETAGMGRTSDEARAIVIEHDRTTKAESGLPLA